MTLLVATLSWGEAPQSTLDLAYQKEYAYLVAERKELEERVAEVKRTGIQAIAEADADLAGRQAALVTATRVADRAEDTFDTLERESSGVSDAEALLSTTLFQGAESLALALPDDAALALPQLFDAAAVALGESRNTGWRDGVFFLPSGEQVTGRVYQFGQVAGWGMADAGRGALAPAGEGRLQLRESFGATTATALASNSVPSMLEIQLFEADRGAEEAEKKGGLGQLLSDAGTMGQVLFGLGLVSAGLVVIRAVSLLFARRGGQEVVDAAVDAIRDGDVPRALANLGRRGGPTARVVRSIVENAHRSPAELDRVVDESILKETPAIDRFASALTVITAGAPLLGLLGTVTGMIATFEVITEHGTGNPKLMSAGIAEALVCTALGLAVAIPTLLAGNVLASIADTVKNRIDRAALSTLNALEARPVPSGNAVPFKASRE